MGSKDGSHFAGKHSKKRVEPYTGFFINTVQVDGGPYTDFDHFKPLTASYPVDDNVGFGFAFKGINLKDVAQNHESYMKFEGDFQSEFIFDDEFDELQAGFDPADNATAGVYKFYVRQTITSYWKLLATITLTDKQ